MIEGPWGPAGIARLLEKTETVLASPCIPPKVQLFLYQELLRAKGRGTAWPPNPNLVRERQGTSRLYFPKYLHCGRVVRNGCWGHLKPARNCTKIWFKERGEIQTVCDGKQIRWSTCKAPWVERTNLVILRSASFKTRPKSLISVTVLLVEAKQRVMLLKQFTWGKQQ